MERCRKLKKKRQEKKLENIEATHGRLKHNVRMKHNVESLETGK